MEYSEKYMAALNSIKELLNSPEVTIADLDVLDQLLLDRIEALEQKWNSQGPKEDSSGT